MEEQVAMVQKAAESTTKALRAQLAQLEGNTTSISMELPGGAVATVARLKFTEEEDVATSLTIADPGLGTEVTLPKSFLLGTLAAIDEPVFLELVSSGSALDPAEGSGASAVQATVSLSFKRVSGAGISVNGLAEPIKFTMPVNYSRGLVCAFWDEHLGSWSTEGVLTNSANAPGAPLSCATRHLTFFGAILQGFVETVACAKFTLFTADGFSQLTQSSWYKEPSVLIFWCVLLVLVILMMWATFLDRWYRPQGDWSPESLFLLIEEKPAARRANSKRVVTIAPPERPSVISSDEEQVPTEAARVQRNSSSRGPGRVFREWDGQQDADFRGRRSRVSVSSTFMAATSTMSSGAVLAAKSTRRMGMKGLFLAIVGFCMENTVRDACDEVFSDWFEYFSEMRSSAEDICSEISMDWTSVLAASHFAMWRLVMMTSGRSAAASLGCSWDLVLFILEEEQLKALLTNRHLQRTKAGLDPRPPAEPWWKCEVREDAWCKLHDDVSDALLEQVPSKVWRTLPCRILANYLVENPIGRICTMDIFMTRKMRALFYMMEFLGSMMVVSMFFANSGSMKGKPKFASQAASCGDESLQEELMYKIGRAWAIAVGSAVLAGIPVSLISSLRTVDFKTVDEEGGELWTRQLRRWQTQSRMIWVLGTLYLLFCAFYCSLFLANLGEDDLKDWEATLLMSLAWEVVFLPLIKAMCMPTMASTLLHANAWHGGVDHGHMVRHVRQHLHDNTNIRLPIMTV